MNKLNIVSVIEREGLELKRRGKSLSRLCPFHSEKTPSFTVDPEKQVFYCHGCHKGGDAVAFVRELKGLSFPDALKYLGMRDGENRPTDTKELKERKAVSAFKQWCRVYHNELCEEYRTLDHFLGSLRSPEDLDDFGELFPYRADMEHHLDVLEGYDDEAKFLLFDEVTNGV